MSTLAIIHYFPLEYYPPITNLIDYILTQRDSKFNSINIYSCNNVKRRKIYIPDKNTKFRVFIHRSPFPKVTDTLFLRTAKYLFFNIFTLFSLCIKWPEALLYFETSSAWPVYIYSRFLNKKCNILIHYHEYANKGWYENTNMLVRFFHKLEKSWLYAKAEWISQTNQDRLKFFHQDNPELDEERLNIVPNFPPKSWNYYNGKNQKQVATSISKGLKIVYIGSLSFKSTYIKEFCEWIINQNGAVIFDIYAFNLYQDVIKYLKQIDSQYIKFYENGIEYNLQPSVLKDYDIGVILYKGLRINTIYCASNKLFEYLACGLDVWFPKEMIGTYPYITDGTYPKVIKTDFERLDELNLEEMISHKELTYKPSEYFAEKVYGEFFDKYLK